MNLKRALFRIASSKRLLALSLALVALGSTGIALAAYGFHVLARLEGSTVDARFSIRGHQPAPKNIVIVKVDDATFQDLNQQWPFPRRMQGRLIARIARQHPTSITEDIQYSESSQLGTRDDYALATAVLGAHVPTVFSFTETNANGHVRFLGSTEGTKLLDELHAHPGMGLFPGDGDQVTRRMSYEILGLKTLAIVTAGVSTGHPVSRARFDGGGHALIDFIGPSGSFPSISYSTALRGKLPPDFFRGKYVIVGATAPSLQDIHATSTDPQMSGPEEQANALYTALREFPLAYVPGWLNVLLIVVLGVTVPLISVRLGPVAATAVAIAMGGVYVLAAQLAFDGGAVISLTYPLTALLLSGAGSLAVQLLTEAFERIRTRDLFARFVPENVVDELLKSSDGLRLGGTQREGTVMFTDLRGFTSLAESLTPARVIEILNRYLSEMSDAILDHGGTLVAYMGDGIMAVFGAPLPQADHADRALATAREMLSVRLPRFNQWLRDEQLSEGFKMGIGLNSGNVMSGHVGSE
ncbi:MAG: adenylate/guanylate cyclase domain-containing protein, partial [Actinobacteria bacterium]|nr:adenylate/guanylate cyclase domain-containing protein [Actinomycetota bacterium]